MLRIGITGQKGFLGQHLYNTLALFPEFERIDCDRDIFENPEKLNAFVSKCDVIVHLAALNRHPDPQVVYELNIGLVNKLIVALEATENKAHILFSSSSQEERDNLYGKSKKQGREILTKWCKSHGNVFTGLLIPNVFGPYGSPYYNSFIATFCHQLVSNEQPVIDTDGDVKLIYVDELIKVILREIRSGLGNDTLVVPHNSERKVSEILRLLEDYKTRYFQNGIIPEMKSTFEINLFNTFRSYIDLKSHFPVKFIKNTDARGAFVEVLRLNAGGQVSFSTTVPGITRGNHFHTRKIERFAVIKGEALIQLRKTGTAEILDFNLSGDTPAYVDMPIWYTHNIKNTGSEELYTIFWINEFYDPADPDTYFESV